MVPSQCPGFQAQPGWHTQKYQLSMLYPGSPSRPNFAHWVGGNPESMGHPKDHSESLVLDGPPGFFYNKEMIMTTTYNDTEEVMTMTMSQKARPTWALFLWVKPVQEIISG